MIRTILVPIDFSGNSLNALEYASAIARKINSRIILLNTYFYTPPSTEIPLPVDLIGILRESSDKRLKELSGKISQQKKLKCSYISKFDMPVDAIIDTCKEKKVGLIVMGTKGASGIKKVLMGSNTASAIARSTCPVIAVPEGAKFKGIKKVLYATNYLESDIEALKKLAEIVENFHAHIHLFHVSDTEFNRFSENEYLKIFLKKIQKKFKYRKISYGLTENKLMEKALQKEINHIHPDLICMSTRHRNMMERMFGTSATRKMAFHTKVPLLAFHHKKGSLILI